MHLIYIDDARDEQLCVFSALGIPAASWRESFSKVRDFRRELRRAHGVFVHKEFHAWKLVSGRGQIAEGVITKARRCEIFRDILRLVTELPGARLFNAVFGAKEDKRAFERLTNRINRTMLAWDSHALLICDEGKEKESTRLVRRLAVFNPIPSQFGSWPAGTATKNIPTERIIEDPVFKRSDQSYFVQLADCCAYALLRRERPIASKVKYGIDRAFDIIVSGNVLVREATRRDPEGILRP